MARLANILAGAGEILDLMPSWNRARRIHRILSMPDAEAIASDWAVVGRDMTAALRTFRSTLPQDVRERADRETSTDFERSEAAGQLNLFGQAGDARSQASIAR
jgi:hypothetical protein